MKNCLNLVAVFTLLSSTVSGAGNLASQPSGSVNGDGWSEFGWSGNGCSGRIEALATGADGKLYLGGVFAACGDVPSRNLVRWDPTTNLFEDIGGVEGGDLTWGIRGIVADGDDVYVAGNFGIVSGLPSNSIARFNTLTQQWDDLGEGLRSFNGDPGYATEMLRSGGELIVRGSFSTAGTTTTSGFARYDTQTQAWTALASTIPSGVSAMAVEGGNLFVAGSFSSIGPVPANRLARLDLVNGTWHPLVGTSAMTGTTFDIAVTDNRLVVVGRVGTIGTIANTAIAAYDLTSETWELISDASGQMELLAGAALVAAQGDLLLSARIQYSDESTARGVVRINGISSIWDLFAEDFRLTSVFDSGIKTIAINGGVVSVGGGFVHGDAPMRFNVARFDFGSGVPTSLGSGPPATINASAEAITPHQDGFIVSGLFTQAGAAIANNVAYLDPSSNQWEALEEGWGPSEPFGLAAAVEVGSQVFVGGSTWQDSSGELQSAIAVFDSVSRTWSVPDKGIFGRVNALASDGSAVYAGGQFTQAGGAVTSNVARYDLATGLWSPLGTNGMEGVDREVFRLRVHGNDIYAWGSFFNAGGVAAATIARFDTISQTWHALGDQSIGGLQTAIVEIAVAGDSLYVAGNEGFPNDRARLARFDIATQSWTSETDGPYLEGLSTVFAVRALVAFGDYLYAGGDFLLPGSPTRYQLARMNLVTGEWTGLTQSADGPIRRIAFNGPYMAVSGLFDYVGGKLNPRFALYDDSLLRTDFE